MPTAPSSLAALIADAHHAITTQRQPLVAAYTVRARNPGDWFAALTAIRATEALFERCSGRSLASVPLVTETLGPGIAAESRIDATGAGLVLRMRDDGGDPMNGFTLRLEIFSIGLPERAFLFTAAIYCETQTLSARGGHLTQATLLVHGDPSSRVTLAADVTEAFAAMTLEPG